MKKKWLVTLLLATFACVVGAFGLTACKNNDDDTSGHTHIWSAWSVADENKPSATSAGKATRTCSADGCDATAADKEYTLPDLTSADYTLTGNTATCASAGTATYAYSKDGVSVTFTAATSAKGHVWSAWTVTDENQPDESEPGKATRACSAAGCDATAADKEYTLPDLTSADYTATADTATCTSAGVITYTYNKNDVSVNFDVATPVKEHTSTATDSTAATCTEPALAAGTRCSVCKAVLTGCEETAPAKGHKFSNDDTHTENKTAGYVSKICTVCETSIKYYYETAVTTGQGVNNAVALVAGVNYVTQRGSSSQYCKYTVTQAGTYNFYFVNLNQSYLNVNIASWYGTSSTSIIGSTATNPAVDYATIEAYTANTSGTTYIEGNSSSTLPAGTFITLTTTKRTGGKDYNAVKFSVTLSEDKFNGVESIDIRISPKVVRATQDEPAYYLIGVGEMPTGVEVTYPEIAAKEYEMEEDELNFAPITAEKAGAYTFAADAGTYNLYVNDVLYSVGEKDYFGYANFTDKYLTVTLEEGDVVKVTKISGKSFTVLEGNVAEPEPPRYSELNLGSNNTITLSDINITATKYEDATETFYTFTAPESGYYEVSVANDVTVNAIIRVDKIHYYTVFDVVVGNKHSGAFKAEEGETVILAFVGNNSTEFTVSIASCEEPITYLKVNEKVEKIYFDGVETFVKLTVDDSVTEGTYELTFACSTNFLNAYVYFSINEEIEVDDVYDTNAVPQKYVNPDMAAGADHTVGAATRPDKDDDFKRTITVKGGDVIYLATTATTSGTVDVTLTPVA